MFSAANLSAISAGAFPARTTVERPKVRDNDAPGKPATRRIAACWSCGRPIALKPGFRVYHCESCDVRGSDEPALVRATLAEQKCYLFVGCDGRTTVEHYVEHNDSSLPSPA
jgi:ribosomal protein L37AE/L43A